MGLRIKTNTQSLISQRQLSYSTKGLSDSMERLASGYRINKSADDAAGLAISDNLNAKIRSLDQARRNATDGISLVQVAEGSMNEITNIMIRLRELATQAASDTISNGERQFTNREYVQLVEEIDRISATTEFNGLQLLKGAEGNNGDEELSIHVHSGDGLHGENIDTIKIDVESFKFDKMLDYGFDAEGSEIGPRDDGEEFSRVTAAEKMGLINGMLTKIASGRATLGSKQSRLQSAVNNLNIQIENMQSSRSRIKDVDFAAETATFTQNKILQQAGVSVLSQANSAPDVVLNLLR